MFFTLILSILLTTQLFSETFVLPDYSKIDTSGLPSKYFEEWNYMNDTGKAMSSSFDRDQPNTEAYYKVYFDETGTKPIKVERYQSRNFLLDYSFYAYKESGIKDRIDYFTKFTDCRNSEPTYRLRNIDDFQFLDKYLRVSRYFRVSGRSFNLESVSYYTYSWKLTKLIQMQGKSKQWTTYYSDGKPTKVTYYEEGFPVYVAVYNDEKQIKRRQLYEKYSNDVEQIEKFFYDDEGRMTKKTVFAYPELKKAIEVDVNYSSSGEAVLTKYDYFNEDGTLVKSKIEALSGTKYQDGSKNDISQREFYQINSLIND